MKLMRYGSKGHEKPALLDDKGRVRDLSGLMADITPATLTPALARARSACPIVSFVNEKARKWIDC